MNQELEKERIKGRYSVIVAIITTIAAIIGPFISARYAPIETNKNLDAYTSKVQNEVISQQNTDFQKELDKLNGKIAELQGDNDDKVQQIDGLEKENENLLRQIAEKNRIIDNLEKQSLPNVPNIDPSPNSKELVKLTSTKLLGNNQNSLNYINNTQVNEDTAKSNLGELFDSSISMRRNGNIDFYLGSSYETLSFTICISEDTKNVSDYSSTLTIYKVEGNGDDETLQILYASSALTMGFIPTKPPPIDVSDVTHLRISFYSDAGYNVVPRIILGNPMLTPK